MGTVLILYNELQNKPRQMITIMILYGALALFAWLFSKSNTE